ncbi:hypothetical protein [Asaia sp. VD9]|uniref:OmpA family protein n=1 Tax=Asaia sp. VD9 TaxID=3081235 RepID=UPI003019B272
MKRPILLSLLFSAGLPAALLISAPSMAQVTSNDDALPAAAPASKPAAQKAAKKPAQGKSHADKPAHTSPHKAQAHDESPSPAEKNAPTGKAVVKPAPAPSHAPAAQRVGAPPDVPPQPPRPVVIPPPGVKVPTHPPVPPEEIKPDPEAKGKVEKQAKGLRVLFDANSSGMSPAMIEAVQSEARQLATQPTLRITLWSSASGSTEDLSTPRRIALARALAVRSILIREGVATTRIYPRATGLAQPGSNPPDRLDIVAEGSVPAPSSEAQFGTEPRTSTP